MKVGDFGAPLRQNYATQEAVQRLYRQVMMSGTIFVMIGSLSSGLRGHQKARKPRGWNPPPRCCRYLRKPGADRVKELQGTRYSARVGDALMSVLREPVNGLFTLSNRRTRLMTSGAQRRATREPGFAERNTVGFLSF